MAKEEHDYTESVLRLGYFRIDCPTSEDLVGYQEGWLVDTQQQIKQHLTLCTNCQKKMAMLTALDAVPFFPDPNPDIFTTLSEWLEYLKQLGKTIFGALLQPPAQLVSDVRGGTSAPIRKAKPIQMTRVYDADEYEIHLTITPPAIAEEIWKIHGEIYHSILDEFSGEIYLFQSDNLAGEVVLNEDEDGEFAFDDLKAGEYSLLVNTSEAALHIDGFRLEWTPPELADLLLNQNPDDKKNLAHLLEQLRPDLTLELIEEFKRRVDGEMYRNASRALEIADVAVKVADFIPNAKAKALALRAKGNPLHLLVRNQEALICMKRAEEIYAQLGQPFDVAVMQLNQVAVRREMGEYENAITLYHEARKTCKNIGSLAQRDLILASLEGNIGATYWLMGELTNALNAYDRSYNLFEALPGGGQETRMAMIDINRANVLEEMDRFSEAERLYIRARDVFASAGHKQEVARAELSLGVLAYRRGQYQAALRYLEAAHKGFTYVANETEIAVVDLYRSFVYRHLNMLEETIDLATRAEQTLQKEEMPWQQAQALINQGLAHQRLGEYAEADERLFKAQAIFREQGATYRAQQLNLDRADLALQKGDFKAAQNLADEVQASLDLTLSPSLAARHHLVLARCALASTNSDRSVARSHIEQALAIANSHHLHEVAISAHHLMGQIFEGNGDHEAAWQKYHNAIQKIEWLRNLLALDEFRLGFIEDKLPIYANALRLSHQMANPVTTTNQRAVLAKVFYTLNLAVSAPLRRLRPLEERIKPEDQALHEQLDELRKEWCKYQSKLEEINRKDSSHGRGTSENEPLDQLNELGRQIAELMRRLQVRNPLLLEPQEATPTRISKTADYFLSSIQARLAPQELLLQYYLVNEQVQALLVTSNSIRLVQDLTSVSDFDETCGKWFKVVETFTTIGLSQHKFSKVKKRLRAFYKKLIIPIEPYLTNCEKIFLVMPPDWHDLPVGAFFDRQHYLAQRFQLLYLSTPETLLNEVEAKEFVLSVAGTKPINGDEGNQGKHALVIGYSDKGRVPYTLHEARQVAEMLTPHLPTTLLLEEEVTFNRFKGEALGCGLLHLGSHAKARSDNPLFSWVQLADRYLTVAELYNEVSLAERPLVVLSACQTGKGQARGGGLLGMGRGFMAAGANGLIVTLWDVPDQSTAELMNDFYTHLIQQRATPPAALQHAQQQAIARGYHPYHWAAFIFIQG